MGTCGITLLLVLGIMIYLSVKGSVMNKKGKEKEASLPKEKILLSMCNDTKTENLQKMHGLGAKMMFLEPSLFSAGVYYKTILTDKALCFASSTARYYVNPPSLNAEIKFVVEENKATTYTTKNKSTVGRAIVGGALAGGAGAVVGAASALSGGGTKTVSRTHKTGDYHLKINLSDVSSIEPKILYVSNKLIDKIGPLFPNGQKDEGSPYTKYNISGISISQKNEITKYTEKSINTK